MSRKLGRNAPTVIDDVVWLGPAPVNQSSEAYDDSDTSHVAVLRAAGITHVVNCTPDVPFISATQLGLAAGAAVGEFRVPVPDEDGAADALDSFLDAATSFIQDAAAAGGRVYVHCETGKSRSATVVLAYLVRHRGKTLREAYNETKAKREYIQPKTAFFDKLIAREPDWAAAGVASFAHEEYALIYLLDHFIPTYTYVEGITKESIRAAIAEADGDSTVAMAKLVGVVRRG